MQNPTAVRESFTSFFEDWIIRQKQFLEKLEIFLASIDGSGINQDEGCRDMVAQLLAHYQEYYQEKIKAASEDVFLMLSQPWLSPFERTLLWVSGFKPSMTFSLIKNSMAEELSAEQSEKIEMMRSETRKGEREIEQEMAKVQESAAGPTIFKVIRTIETLVDGEISELDEITEELKASMFTVLENADGLRGSTVRKVVEILSPVQTLKFFAAAARFGLRVRNWGRQRQSQLIATAEECSASD